MEADGIGGGRKGGTRYTNPKDTISSRFGRLNERRRAESVVIERRTTHTKHIRIHNITTVRQPERKEATGSGSDRSQKAYKEHLEQKPISPRFGGLHVEGQAGPMVVRESRHMLTYAENRVEGGVKSRRSVDCKVETC